MTREQFIIIFEASVNPRNCNPASQSYQVWQEMSHYYEYEHSLMKSCDSITGLYYDLPGLYYEDPEFDIFKEHETEEDDCPYDNDDIS
tara:strand:+ start:2411 stop:2674 length:264 start_codon:yes stop_codon:yes gene_type:complete